MSSLTEQERIGLEEVFLSISPSRSVFRKWPSWKKTLGILMKSKRFISPFLTTRLPYFWAKTPLNGHKTTKLLNKMQKRRKI